MSSSSATNADEENPVGPLSSSDTTTPVPIVPLGTRWLLQEPKARYDSTTNNNSTSRHHKQGLQHPGLGLLTFAYLIEPDSGLREVSVHEALHRSDRQQHAWIDAILYNETHTNTNEQQQSPPSSSSSSFQDLQRLIFNELSMSSFLRRHLNQPQLLHTPQVLSLTNALLMVMRIINVDNTNNNDASSADGKAASYTAILCLEEGLIVSITKASTSSSSSSSGQQLRQENRGGSSPQPQWNTTNNKNNYDDDNSFAWRHQQHYSTRLMMGLGTLDTSRTVSGGFLDRELIDPSLSGCLVMYLSYHLEETASATHYLRARVMNMLELLDQNIAAVQLQQVVELKNALMRLSAVAEEQHQCIMRLADADESNDSFQFVKGSIHVLLSLASSTERMVDRLEGRMIDIREGYESYQQERIKKRLNLLTVMSAVFLPLTLMAGIWDFQHMPELSTQFGYYYALASMMAVAFGLMGCFYWNGWLS